MAVYGRMVLSGEGYPSRTGVYREGIREYRVYLEACNTKHHLLLVPIPLGTPTHPKESIPYTG